MKSNLSLSSIKIIRILKKTYPKPIVGLNFSNSFELLISTILSAQCTDIRVNLTTPLLFKTFPNSKSLSTAKSKDVEKIIKSTGFFRAKAKNIINCAIKLENEFDGIVPNKMEKLIQLPGVGRKTANCVLGTYFNKPVGIVVDTHVKRISFLLGLTNNVNPEKIEFDLMKIIEEKDWHYYSNALINHGREVCIARRPKCNICSLKILCPSVKI